ncbi:MAG: hypothetical protein H6740_22810 [Alphaproteobacteria bacterium]|nr:hypothetical protein [Alphaproteobacteria bacterium]
MHLALLAGTLAAAELDLSLRPEVDQVLDPVASPLPYQGVGAPVSAGLRWRGRGPTWALGLSATPSRWTPQGVGPRVYSFERVDAVTGETTTVLVPAPKLAFSGDVHAAATWDLGPLSLGPRLDWQALYTSGAMSMGQWAWSVATLGLRVEARAPWRSRSELGAGLTLPVGGVVTRIPEDYDLVFPDVGTVGAFFQQGSQLASWGHLQQAELELWHRVSLSPIWSVGLDARLRYSRLVDTTTAQRLTSSLGLGATRLLGV